MASNESGQRGTGAEQRGGEMPAWIGRHTHAPDMAPESSPFLAASVEGDTPDLRARLASADRRAVPPAPVPRPRPPAQGDTPATGYRPGRSLLIIVGAMVGLACLLGVTLGWLLGAHGSRARPASQPVVTVARTTPARVAVARVPTPVPAPAPRPAASRIVMSEQPAATSATPRADQGPAPTPPSPAPGPAAHQSPRAPREKLPEHAPPKISVARSGPFHPSFRCDRANPAAMQTVCRDRDLAALDNRVSAAFTAALKRSPSRTDALHHDQGKFLNDRGRCSGKRCLLTLYRERLHQLERG